MRILSRLQKYTCRIVVQSIAEFPSCMFVNLQSHSLRRGTAVRNTSGRRDQGEFSRRRLPEVELVLHVGARAKRHPLWLPSYCGNTIHLPSHQLQSIFMNIKQPTSTSARTCFRHQLSCPLIRHPRITIILNINKSILASSSHSSRRARAWQKRGASTVRTISDNRLPLGTRRSQSDRLPLPSTRLRQPPTHLQANPTEEFTVDDPSRPSPHEPHPASSPGSSPRSSVNQLHSENDDMSSSDDQIRLAELAAAKLERQSQRNIANDPTVPAAKVNKPRTVRGKAPKVWKPLSLADSSDDNTPSANPSRRASPLDVHAKVFLPGLFDTSVSCKLPGPVRKDSAYLSDEDSFQLVTKKNTKPSSKPAAGLNAYEVNNDDKSSAIVAPVDKRELNEVFGNDLPGPDFFLSTPGSDGQVHFAMHPNGDVSAQQWHNDGYHWTSIGQFSNVRKKTEGHLSSHRLKGETERHSLLQNTLSYFRAVALQHEATTKGLPFGSKELQAVMPNVPIERGSSRKVAGPSLEQPTYSLDSHSNSLPVIEQTDYETSMKTTYKPVGPSIQHLWQGVHQSIGGSGDSNFNNFLSSLSADDGSSNSVYDSPPKGLTALNNLAFGTFPTGRERTSMKSESQFRMPDLKASAYTESSDITPYFDAPPAKRTHQAAKTPGYALPLDCSSILKKAQPQVASTPQATSLAQRSFMKACLNRLGETAVARGANAAKNPSPRTVLYDPFQNQSKVETNTPSHSTQSRRSDTMSGTAWSGSPYDLGSSALTSRVLTSSNQTDTSLDLRISEPESGWKDRQVNIVNIAVPSNMSTQELAAYSKPTPQNWNGPFFTGSPDRPGEANMMSHDEELRDWFNGGNNVQRQEDFFQRIKAAHQHSINSTPPQSPPGPIGPPSALTTPKKNRETEVFNEVTTRLLVPVLENLSQYVQGPTEQRHGYFAPFGPAPEWCIDKSPNGNNSFFGEDWGKPPERIGRDARYRPLLYEGKFGKFDPQYSDRMSGGQAYNGRFQYSPRMKY